MRAVQITEFGGPEVVRVREVPEPVAGDGEVLVDVSRAGVNFADTLLRENRYLAEQTLPLIPGGEIVGRTPDGRRVAAMVGDRGYAERVAVKESWLLDVPDGVDDVAAVALLAQGLTAWWLIERTTRVEPGETVVVHAAAGGVGTLAVQLAKAAGARVIASASSPEKRDLALSLGADAAVDPAAEDLTAALREANGGRPVDVVLEMVGGPVTDASVAALAPFGRLAFYGMASQVSPTPIKPRALMPRSITISGFWLINALPTRFAELRKGYAELGARVAAGTLRVVGGGDHPMSEVVRVHDELRSRRTTGKLVLDPSR